jgi:hypothetical protein
MGRFAIMRDSIIHRIPHRSHPLNDRTAYDNSRHGLVTRCPMKHHDGKRTSNRKFATLMVLYPTIKRCGALNRTCMILYYID